MSTTTVELAYEYGANTYNYLATLSINETSLAWSLVTDGTNLNGANTIKPVLIVDGIRVLTGLNMGSPSFSGNGVIECNQEEEHSHEIYIGRLQNNVVTKISSTETISHSIFIEPEPTIESETLQEMSMKLDHMTTALDSLVLMGIIVFMGIGVLIGVSLQNIFSKYMRH